jgi:UDP-N-acetyl-D-glucosamine dehydrogenase
VKVSIVGQGYVGLPLALAVVKSGLYVNAVDADPSLVELLNSGKSRIEDVSDAELIQTIKTGRYQVSSDFKSLSDSNIIVVCVPTPLVGGHEPDYSHLESALTSISQNLTEGSLVIIESTVAPGTTRGFVGDILNKSGKQYELAYSPERIDPANKIWNITNTPKLVAGITNSATRQAVEFYERFVDEVIAASSVEVIETAKLLENSFRLINISFINEIAEFCWKMKINIGDVISAAELYSSRSRVPIFES